MFCQSAEKVDVGGKFFRMGEEYFLQNVQRWGWGRGEIASYTGEPLTWQNGTALSDQPLSQ